MDGDSDSDIEELLAEVLKQYPGCKVVNCKRDADKTRINGQNSEEKEMIPTEYASQDERELKLLSNRSEYTMIATSSSSSEYTMIATSSLSSERCPINTAVSKPNEVNITSNSYINENQIGSQNSEENQCEYVEDASPDRRGCQSILNDNDYIISENSSSSEYEEKSTSFRKKQYDRRMKGKSYIGFGKQKNSETQQNIRPARTLGEPCNSNFCRRVSARQCGNITQEMREIIFKQFWSNMDWQQRKIYVINNVTLIEPKRRYTENEESRRSSTLIYKLSFENERYSVCKRLFLSTLGLREYSVRDWVTKFKHGMCNSQLVDNEMRKNNSEIQAQSKRNHNNLDEFFDSLPKLPSHYARKETSKLYLEQNITSISQLYRLYCEKIKSENSKPFDRKIFTRRFSEKKLSIHKLKKDKCNICTQHEVGNLSDEEWKSHVARKNRARLEKETDKDLAKNYNRTVLTMDLQAVKVSPCLNANATFYKTKLSCHNFTVYNLNNHHTMCYWFSEIDCDLSASTFTTCIIDYMEHHCQDATEIIIYSDGCTYQNRNITLANGLLDFAVSHSKIITQKFLERGHTQMECDSVHSCIERKLKVREIHLPSDYLTATKEARQRPFPYEAKWMYFSDFRDYSDKRGQRYTNLRPGLSKVVDIRGLRYDGYGKIHYKLNFDEDWQPLPRRSNSLSKFKWPLLYTENRKISSLKFKHLQELKSVLPKDCHGFYDGLSHEE